ncbi:hypothetical protein Pmani_014624 [Petrolisthes manimaculis]|uniref:Uncharacterized protein n=1 Tax=Petrolisthes manimaculis TaxID=1843537 RepID=A0AAE1UAS0_9EUCA|nr:hypothetical protein Pmani_014624 [Petrolisthes manimaculis]
MLPQPSTLENSGQKVVVWWSDYNDGGGDGDGECVKVGVVVETNTLTLTHHHHLTLQSSPFNYWVWRKRRGLTSTMGEISGPGYPQKKRRSLASTMGFRWVCVMDGNEVEVGEVAQALVEVTREPVEVVVEMLKEVVVVEVVVEMLKEAVVEETLHNVTAKITLAIRSQPPHYIILVEKRKPCSGFAQTCEEFGLTISLKKTDIMGQDVDSTPSIFIGDYTLEVVTNSTNLSLDVQLNTRRSSKQ